MAVGLGPGEGASDAVGDADESPVVDGVGGGDGVGAAEHELGGGELDGGALDDGGDDGGADEDGGAEEDAADEDDDAGAGDGADEDEDDVDPLGEDAVVGFEVGCVVAAGLAVGVVDACGAPT